MSVDQNVEKDNSGWGDLKSTSTKKEAADSWEERRSEQSAAKDSKDLESQKKPRASAKRGGKASDEADKACVAAKMNSEKTEEMSGETFEGNSIPTKKGEAKDGDLGREEDKKESETKKAEKPLSEEPWNADSGAQWGRCSERVVGDSKPWNDLEKSMNTERGKKDMHPPSRQRYEGKDYWQDRRGQKRPYDTRDGGYEDERRYESRGYPPRKRRMDDGYFSQAPSRFRDAHRYSPRGEDVHRRNEWSSREDMHHKDAWAGPKDGFGVREGFEARDGWSRPRFDGYRRPMPRSEFDGMARDGWERPRDFGYRGEACDGGWGRTRNEGYGLSQGREDRRGDFKPHGWDPRCEGGDFGGEQLYGDPNEPRRYKPYGERPRYHREGPYHGPSFRRKREIPVNPPPSKVIGLFGLSSHATLDDVKEFLAEKIPDIRYENVHLVKDGYTGQSRGFGFIYFSSLDEAITAKELLQGQSIYNKAVRVDYSVSEGPRTASNGNHYGNN